MFKYTGQLNSEIFIPNTFQDYRILWTKAEAREILTHHPLHLDIELTSHCNLKCKMCWQSEEMTAPMGYMKEALFMNLIDEGIKHGLASIKLQIRGESTMHPKIAKLAKYAKDAGIFDVQLTTNGSVLGKKKYLLKSLIESGIDKIIYSIDPEHDESADEIYGKDKAPDIKQVFKDSLKLRQQNDSKKPIFRIQTITLDNQTKQQRLAQIKRDYPDANEYMINPLWNSKWDEDSLEGLSDHYELMACSILWTRLAVFWNGDVHLCCRDYNGIMPIGNAVNELITAIWQSQKMNDIRQTHLQGLRKNMIICKHCDVCTQEIGSKERAEGLWVKDDDYTSQPTCS